MKIYQIRNSHTVYGYIVIIIFQVKTYLQSSVDKNVEKENILMNNICNRIL